MMPTPRALPLVALLAGCTASSHVATVSERDAGVDDTGSTDTGSTIVDWPPPESCTASAQDPMVTWDGWVEAFDFGGGSDRIRVLVEPDGAGGFTGYFLAGEGPHIDGTPRAPDDCTFLCTYVDETLFGSRVIQGFRYPLHDVTYTEIRLRFDVSTWDIFDPWCRAQAPIEDEENTGRYGCIRNLPAETNSATRSCDLLPPEGGRIEIPCCAFDLCSHVCDCTSDECFAHPQNVTFDLFIEGDVASGTTPWGTAHVQRR